LIFDTNFSKNLAPRQFSAIFQLFPKIQNPLLVIAFKNFKILSKKHNFTKKPNKKFAKKFISRENSQER